MNGCSSRIARPSRISSWQCVRLKVAQICNLLPPGQDRIAFWPGAQTLNGLNGSEALPTANLNRSRWRLGFGRLLGSFLVFSFSALFASAGGTTSYESLFREGANAYRAADYEAATKFLRESVLLHPASGTYQNLGLSEWQHNQTGPAVLAWEQSLWLDPFNKSAHNNLRFARKAAQIDAPELSWDEVISTWLPVNWWGWIVCLSLWLAIGAISIPIFLRRPKASWHQGVAAFGLMLFLLGLPAQLGVHKRERIGFVMEKGTALRLTPTSEAQTTSQLAAGEPVRWMRARGDFLLVRSNRATGWVQRKQLGFLISQRNGTPTPN